MFNLQSVLAERARTATGQFAGTTALSHNRSDATVVVPAQKRNEALTHFAGEKVGEALMGFGLGYVVAMGEPMFMTDPTDTTKGFGLVPLVAGVTNLAEVIMIWTGWTPSKKIGGMAGLLVDGMVRGGASASNSAFWYGQGNIFGLAKGGHGTPGVSTLGMYDQPQSLGMGSGYAPMPEGHGSLHAPKVQAARAASLDPNAFYF